MRWFNLRKSKKRRDSIDELQRSIRMTDASVDHARRLLAELGLL